MFFLGYPPFLHSLRRKNSLQKEVRRIKKVHSGPLWFSVRLFSKDVYFLIFFSNFARILLEFPRKVFVYKARYFMSFVIRKILDAKYICK